MDTIIATLASLGINHISAIFGVVGALLHALRDRSKHWVESMVSFFTGCALAAVGPQFIIKWFGLDHDTAYLGGLGFICGYFGMSLVDAGADLIAQLRQMDWKEIASSWFRKG